MKKIILSFAAAVAVSIGMSAHAETLYQIEIIAFARESAEAENEENWDRHYSLCYPERYTNLQATDGSNAPFQLLPADAMQLNQEANVIANRRSMRVLLHQAWRQTVDNPAQATAVIISGGKQFGAHHELEGALTLSVEHFLRVDANMWLSRFANNGSATSAQTLPNPPGVIADNSAQSAVTQTVLLQEQRRLRSGELHYFDHPRLGLLVLVTPVAPPQP